MLKCPSRWEMDADVALNVGITSIGRPNRYELLAWLNESLQTGFTKIEQICTGAAYCQLMHWLFPRTLDLSRVRFQSIDMVDIIHNYGLLQAAFRKVGVLRYIPMDELMKRNSTVVLTFTQWFKAFFDRNNSSDREYHALEARGGQSMVPAEPDDPPSQSPPQKLEIIVKMAGKQVEVPRKEKATESLKKDADVIVLISDDEDDVMVVTPVPKTKKMDTMVKDKSQEEMTVGVRAQQQAEKMDTMVKDKVQEEMNVDVRVQHQAKKMDTTLKDKAQDEMKVGVRVQHQAEKTDVTVKEEVQEMNVDVRVQRQAEKMDTTVKDKAQEEMKMGVRVQQQAEKMDVTVKEEVQEEMNVDVRVQHRAEKVDTTMKDKAQEEIKVEVEAEATVKENDSWLDFITRHFPDNVDLRTEAQVSATLNPTQLDNIRQICSRWPYSLYLYVGLQLGGCQNTGVVLVGYFNQVSGDSVVRPLLTLQMNVVEMDSQTSADTHTFKDMYFIHDDACLLVETLKKIDISLANMAAFYCNVPHPRMSRVFVSKLQAFNPKLVSLCGLPGMATRACEAGLLTSFSCVLELIRDVHYHYYTCPSASSSLRLFTDAESYNPSLPLSAQCLFIIHTVQRMVSNWRGLVDYFKSVRQVGDTCLITDRLMDNKFKLRFIFLSHILEPLRALQELQQSDTAGVAVQLQLTSMLVNSYAASILRPAVAERFLRKRDLNRLQYRTELLPVSEVHVGARAKEFLWATAVVDLGEEERTDFMKDAASFYKAALQTLTESLPEHLGEGALKNIDRLLKHSDNVWRYKMSDETLYELTNQLGLNRPEKNQLSYDYKSFIKIVNKQKLHCWPKMLHVTRPASALRSLLLTLLTLPTSLCRKHVFAKVFNKALQNSPDFTTVSPQPCSWEGIPRIKKLRKPVKAGNSGKRKKEVVKQMEKEKKKEESSSEDGEVVAKPNLNLPFKHFTNEDSDTDNSSDVVDVTEESKLCRTSRLMTKTQSERTPQAQDAYSVDVDDDSDNGDGDVMITSAAPAPAASLDAVGELVWGQVEGFSLWPAIIVPSWGESQHSESRMVEWYGQNMTSQVSVQSLKPFATFAQNFCCNSFAILATYREAIFLSLQEAALRCKKQFSALDEDRYELLKQMLDWAFGGFKPTGPDGLKPTADTNDVTKLKKQPKKIRKEVFLESSSSPSSSVSSNSNVIEKPTSKKTLSKNSTGKSSHKSVKTWEAWDVGFDSAGKATKGVGLEKGRGKGGKLLKKKVHPFDGFHDDDNSPDFVPFKKKNTKIYNKVNETTSSYTQPDQKLRDETIRKIMDMKLDIEGFCLCCGTENVEIFHPLFKGSLCLPCKDNLTETLYRYDEDGYQSYCTICCYGLEVILCGNDGCCRSYCADCLNILVSPGSFESLKEQDPWICYLCQPHQPHGALTPREDWSIRVQELFANNSAMEFEPHRVYPSIPANLRRPARVLSLFDGIATGYVVLKDLGIKVETYVASEVCEDSVAVATINHDGKIIHVGDARYITQEHLDQWGPFDLLIGGSPCNDLSIVNPIRKGLYEGTGRLFFEFYRILQLLKPKDKDPRPFFWLFENVVFMNTHDKVNICRFLECNPVLVDAVKVSPAHRARYFWGNIPGMSRPITASQNDKLNLQDCLEIGREARVTKVRTITTNPNSMKQGKGFLLPVLDNNKEDILWITEVEKIFGFPKHYTDVRNMNRQQRQKVLGKAWSVPVIRHLFAPLKDYFACEELPPLTSSTSPSSPASPELQQLR